LAAVAGILIALDTDMRPTMGFSWLLYGVVAMIIDGVGSKGASTKVRAGDKLFTLSEAEVPNPHKTLQHSKNNIFIEKSIEKKTV